MDGFGSTKTPLAGIVANLPTPFDNLGRVDLERLRQLVEFVISSGVHGVSCLLSSGHFTYLSRDERRSVAKTVIEEARGQVPVLVGVSGQTTSESIELGKEAFLLGVDGALLLPLSYWPLNRAEIMEHYHQVVGTVEGTWGIYNAPKTTGVDLTSDLFAAITQYGPVTFTKDSSGDALRVVDVHEACGRGFAYLCGTEAHLLPSLLLGAQGACIAIASVLPSECRRLYDLAAVGDLAGARELYMRLLPIFRFFQKHTVARSVRLLSEMLGRPLGSPRPPLRPLEGADLRAEIAGILKGFSAYRATPFVPERSGR